MWNLQTDSRTVQLQAGTTCFRLAKSVCRINRLDNYSGRDNINKNDFIYIAEEW